MPRASPETMAIARLPQRPHQTLGEDQARPPRRCASRRSRPRAVQNVGIAADRDQRRGRIDHAQRRRIGRSRTSRRTARRAGARSPIRLPRRPPSRLARRASPPRAAPDRAAPRAPRPASPYRFMSVTKVRGPTVVAADQPQPVEPLRVRQVAGSPRSCLRADPAFRPGDEAPEVRAVLPPQQRREQPERRRRGSPPAKQEHERGDERRRQRRGRGEAGYERDERPMSRRTPRRRATKRRTGSRGTWRRPCRRGTAARRETDGRGRRRRRRRATAGSPAKWRASSDRKRSLQAVEQKRRGREILATGPQHVGRADVARPDGADVGGAGQPRQQQAERDRAEEVAEAGGRQSCRSPSRSIIRSRPPARTRAASTAGAAAGRIVGGRAAARNAPTFARGYVRAAAPGCAGLTCSPPSPIYPSARRAVPTARRPGTSRRPGISHP